MDRHFHPHAFTNNPRRAAEYADTPRGVPTRFSCGNEMEALCQAFWGLVLAIRSTVLPDSLTVAFGASIYKWSSSQIDGRITRKV